MPIYINNNLKYIIIAPQKNGCSTIYKMFSYLNNYNIKNYDINIIGVNEFNNYDKYNIFFIKRNITERFISYLCNIVYVDIDNVNVTNKSLINIFDHYYNTYNEKLTKTSYFYKYIKLLEKINVNVKNDSYDIHYLSQNFWLNEYLNYLNINDKTLINFIDISEINIILLPFLQNVHNKCFDNIPFLNKTNYKHNYLNKDKLLNINNLTIQDLFDFNKEISSNNEFINLINNLYNEDKF
jgi:hypothetical protein